MSLLRLSNCFLEPKTHMLGFFLVLALISSQPVLVITKPASVASMPIHYVPSSVQPGYVVTNLEHHHRGSLRILNSKQEPNTRHLFGLHKPGKLVVKMSLIDYGGKDLEVTIRHQPKTGKPWNDHLLVIVVDQNQVFDFTNQPYVGYIRENEPPGTEVKGMDHLQDDLTKFPYGCSIQIIDDAGVFFKVKGWPTSPTVVSTIDFDRERQPFLGFMLQATCPHVTREAMVTVRVLDDNDNTPHFVSEGYHRKLTMEDLLGDWEHLIQVQALDADSFDTITYSMTDSELFVINSFDGCIGAVDPLAFKQSKSYELTVTATDAAGHQSKGISVRLDISVNQGINQEELLHRFRRQAARPEKVFVVRRSETGQLFTVAEDYSQDNNERFEFDDPEPEGLVIDAATGIISLQTNYVWNATTEILDFSINVTRDGDPDYMDDQPVRMYLVDRDFESPIFTNLPRPMWAAIPMWIRPETTIYTLNAIDAQDPYNAPVRYIMESGGDGCFTVDVSTGEVKVACRQQFIPGMTYTLTLSAQVTGTIQKDTTPTQVLRIRVGEMDPMFFREYNNVILPETLPVNGLVVRIQGESFLDLPLTYTILEQDDVSVGVFSLNQNTGDLTLLRDLTHITDPHQYRMVVAMTEAVTNKQISTDLIVNLQGENVNAPFFPGTVYTVKDISEDSLIGSTIMTVLAVDLDQGINGEMSFSVSDSHFRTVAASGNKAANIIVNQDLDYDLQPLHMYDFTLTATDLGSPPLSGTTRVQVWVTDERDEAPIFDPPEQVIRVNQDAIPNTVIHVVQAYDRDEADTLTFSFEGGTSLGPYDLDENTGHIRLNRKLQAGDPVNFTVIVRDNSSPSLQTTGRIIIETIGVNHPPVFAGCAGLTGVVSVFENQPIGTSVANVTFNETDPGVNGEFTITVDYDLASEQKLFEIGDTRDLGGGQYEVELLTAVMFDREAPLQDVYNIDGRQSYKATILVEDNGTPQLAATCFFFVEIADENDRPPRFDENPAYRVIIKSDITQTTRVVRTFAIDDDIGPNADFTYELTNDANCQNCFVIDQEGWITRGAGTLGSFTSVTLMVTGNDGVNPGENIEVQVAITTNDNDLPPIWDQDIDNINDIVLMENVSLDFLEQEFTTNIQGLLDLREGRTIMENNDLDFRESIFGDQILRLRVAKTLDYEEVTQYSLRLRASARDAENTGPFNDARLRITLLDVNDYIPEFVGVVDDTGSYPAAVSDQTLVGDVVVKVTAIDRDGTAAHNTVTYLFHPECGDDCNAFGINTNTGDITATQLYDPNIKPEYFVRVIATDNSPAPDNNNQPNEDDIIVRIVVTGTSANPPYFEQNSYAVTLDSGAMIGTNVTRVTATDPLQGGNAVQYQILAGNDKRHFAVDSVLGVIYTTGEILFEDEEVYNLTYGVFDGFVTDETMVTITITQRNVYPPDLSQTVYDSDAFTENEQFSTGNPKPLVTVAATDREDGSSISYSLEGRFVTGTRFQVMQSGDVLLQAPLDRDYPAGYSNWLVTVVANDNDANPSAQRGYASINVEPSDVNDMSPQFDVCCLVGYVQENSPPGTSVLQLSAVDYDADLNAQLTYGAVSFPEPDGTPLFRVTNAGLVETNVAGTAFDRETTDRYRGVVYAEDAGTPSLRVNQTIDIIITDANEFPPVFNPDGYQFFINEEMPVDSSVGAVFASDQDSGVNARLTFSIVTTGPPQQYFYMDSLFAGQAGVIRMRESLDYEDATDPKTFTFQVSVSDSVNTANTQVQVDVVNVNDHAPVVNPSSDTVSIPENTLDMTDKVFTATDQDGSGGIDFRIDYETSDPDKKFWIDPTSGLVSLVEPLDRETLAYYELHILAVDRGVPPLTGTATLIVTVTDVNDNRPRILSVQPEFPVVGQSTLQGQEVVVITIEDPDEDTNPLTITYECSDQNAPCGDFSFTFDNAVAASGRAKRSTTASGRILAARPDGYSRATRGIDYYDLDFSLSDGVGTPGTDQVRVYIESLNSQAHTSGSNDILVYNYKGELPDTQIGRVFCEDVDDWDLGDKTFNMVEANVNFLVDTDEGWITIKRGTPAGEHVLNVQVADSNFGVTVTCTTRVYVYYLNEEAIASAGSVKISGTTPEQFIERPQDNQGVVQDSNYQKLKAQLETLLGTPQANIHIFTVRDTIEENVIDVSILAQGDAGYYRPARVNGIIWTNKQTLNTELGATIVSSPVSLCRDDLCFGSGCATVINTTVNGDVVMTNRTSLVGIDTSFSQDCTCASTNYNDDVPVCEATTCANGGTCEEYYNGYSCVCPDGFDGPHCEQTKLSFTGSGWAWFDHIPACDTLKISFQFITSQANGILLYNGPMYNTADTIVADFISVSLSGGYPTVRVDVGNGEITMSVNGQDDEGNTVLPALNNGQWHTIEIYKQAQDFRLVVDHCQSAAVNETIDYSDEIRTPCEARASTVGVDNVLNIFTPLELGGRARPSVDRPPGLPTSNEYAGCMKDLWINGLLYDLHIGGVGESVSTEDNCPQEGCGNCPNNSVCVGNLNGQTPQCICLPGFYGPTCASVPVGDFEQDNSFIEWGLLPAFNNTRDVKNSELQLQFRTRRDDGTIFTTNSFSTLERAILEVVGSRLQLRYDLGAGDKILSLPMVNVSDGEWHTAKVMRFGNQVMLRLDHGEGKFQAEDWPSENFRHLVISGQDLTGGAQVYKNPYDNSIVTVSSPFTQSCVRDVRMDESWFPMSQAQNSQSDAADVTDVQFLLDTCNSDACNGVNCPFGQCDDVWREHMCLCPFGEMDNGAGVCIPITDCSIERCVNGDCVMVENPADPGGPLIWRCNCYVGWTGTHCNQTAPISVANAASVSTGWIIAVACAILLLLLIILLVVCLTKRKSGGLLDEPNEHREMFKDYNEEGAGEDDMEAYDIKPLQKPYEVPRPMEEIRPKEVEELPRMAPEPLHQGRAPFAMPQDIRDFKDLPDVGRFILGRLDDAELDTAAPPYDSVREYEYEGAGSSAGSLSSIQTSSSGGDQDFAYLLGLGPPFRKLADIYNGTDEDEDADLESRPLIITDSGSGLTSGRDQGRTLSTSDSHIPQTLAEEAAHQRAMSMSEGNIAKGILRNGEARVSFADDNEDTRRGILKRSSEYGEMRADSNGEGDREFSGSGMIVESGREYSGSGMAGQSNGEFSGMGMSERAYASQISQSEGQANGEFSGMGMSERGYSSQMSQSGGQAVSLQGPTASSSHQSQNVRVVTTTVTRHTTHSEHQDGMRNQGVISGVPQPLTGDRSPPVAMSSGQFDSVDLTTPPHAYENMAYSQDEPQPQDEHYQNLYQNQYNQGSQEQSFTTRVVTTQNRLWSDNAGYVEEYGDV